MKKFLLVVSLCSLVFFTSNSKAKPFERSVILAGGGMSVITYASVLAHLREAGYEPDLVFATCGSALSAVLDMSFKDIDYLKAYVTSKHMHQGLRFPEVHTKKLLDVKDWIDPVGPSLLANMFEDFILKIPRHIPLAGALRSFPRSGTRYVFISGATNHDPESIWANRHKKIFTQTLFTDPETAKAFQGMDSPIARAYPNSRIANKLAVRSDLSPLLAARTSISDPILMNPAQVGDQYFLTGGIDLFPIELAKAVSNEVVATYPKRFVSYMNDIVKNSYGFDAVDRQRMVSEMPGVQWVDMDGVDDSFSPKGTLLLRIIPGVPFNYRKFKYIAERQWLFGKKRAREAIENYKKGKGNSHLRVLFPEQEEYETIRINPPSQLPHKHRRP